MKGPINEPSAPPTPIRTLNRPAFPAGMSSIDRESAETRNSALRKLSEIRTAVVEPVVWNWALKGIRRENVRIPRMATIPARPVLPPDPFDLSPTSR